MPKTTPPLAEWHEKIATDGARRLQFRVYLTMAHTEGPFLDAATIAKRVVETFDTFEVLEQPGGSGPFSEYWCEDVEVFGGKTHREEAWPGGPLVLCSDPGSLARRLRDAVDTTAEWDRRAIKAQAEMVEVVAEAILDRLKDALAAEMRMVVGNRLLVEDPTRLVSPSPPSKKLLRDLASDADRAEERAKGIALAIALHRNYADPFRVRVDLMAAAEDEARREWAGHPPGIRPEQDDDELPDPNRFVVREMGTGRVVGEGSVVR